MLLKIFFIAISSHIHPLPHNHNLRNQSYLLDFPNPFHLIFLFQFLCHFILFHHPQAYKIFHSPISRSHKTPCASFNNFIFYTPCLYLCSTFPLIFLQLQYSPLTAQMFPLCFHLQFHPLTHQFQILHKY